jgi:hypothetical protein
MLRDEQNKGSSRIMHIFLDRKLCGNNGILPILKELNHITMKKTFSFTEFTFNVALLHIHFYNHCSLLIVHNVKKANTSRILYCTPKKASYLY